VGQAVLIQPGCGRWVYRACALYVDDLPGGDHLRGDAATTPAADVCAPDRERGEEAPVRTYCRRFASRRRPFRQASEGGVFEKPRQSDLEARKQYVRQYIEYTVLYGPDDLYLDAIAYFKELEEEWEP
jgi:hypothetical protein